jgi:Phage minor structural protein GP20.
MREFLKGLDFDQETIDTIMAEHGKLLTGVKEKNETLTEQLKAAQEGLTAANAEIESFKGMDIDGIKRAADEWKTKAEEAEQAASARIAEMEYDAALKDALANEKFSSDYARQGIISEIKGKKLPLENGAVMGLADILKAIREEKPDAFAPDKVPASATFGGTGRTPMVPTEKDKAMTDAMTAMGIKYRKDE